VQQAEQEGRNGQGDNKRKVGISRLNSYHDVHPTFSTTTASFLLAVLILVIVIIIVVVVIIVIASAVCAQNLFPDLTVPTKSKLSV
jgi:hypothetical protein